ncbi:MAG TPA: type II toxin-antitoxin system HicB family antitoxin [Rhizomicrobium sp.]|nr:type II toxin-antitoxin system HicB family antitoxin [Rhizomicrobium sp.]
MVRRFYPAVIERGTKKTFGVWFPDFPDVVAAGHSQEEGITKAEAALAQAVQTLAERDHLIPDPTPIDEIVIPKGCQSIAYCMIGAEPPDPSERVNIYLPKSVLARADARAAELGMSRSSFFGLAVSMLVGWTPGTPLSATLKRKSAEIAPAVIRVPGASKGRKTR